MREQWVHWAYPNVGPHFTLYALSFLADFHRPVPEAFGVVGHWYATLSYGVEVKRAPGGEGWKWLFVRFEMGALVNGRFALDVWTLDEQERLVAKNWHTVVVIRHTLKDPKLVKGAKN